MGFHICEYCQGDDPKHRFANTSSGDVTLVFGSRRAWVMPDMILHYVADHRWAPPAEFVDDVMNHDVVAGERLQTKGVTLPTRIGYLAGPFTQGETPGGFVENLARLMRWAEASGQRIQYRGA